MRFGWWCAAAALAWGIVAAWVYSTQELTLSHYDAKGHLVVARRIIDSLTPGWLQVGAVWLPLPHLLNMLPVQVDAFYRTGASGVALSVLCFALAAGSAAALVLRSTGSAAAAVAAAVLLATNPNLLYLQSTPMTEPMLIGLLLLATMCLHAWVVTADERWRVGGGWAIAAACLTRYEAWPFTGAALVLTAVGRWRLGVRGSGVLSGGLRLAMYPALAIAAFMLNSRFSVGKWFVTGGFYVPDPRLQGDVIAVTQAIWFGGRNLGSTLLMVGGVVAAAALLVRVVRDRRAAPSLVPLALLSVAALPWYAFFQGHPFRIRYMVPVVAAASVLLPLGVAMLPRRLRLAAAALVVAGAVMAARPFDPKAAMVQEAQWDRPYSAARRTVTACLVERFAPGDTIMASMGSLAHYMQELSHAGFDIRDFLHEGNGDLWLGAVTAPARHVPWLLVEERAEGGDMLAQRAASDPRFLRGFTRICEGGGVALYGRTADP
jgi:hypothetical protein